MSFYTNKNILVTGGTGMIGRPLVELLLAQGAKVTVASLDDAARCPQGAAFQRLDLRDFNNCLDVCQGKDIVFNLAGVKGSPAMTREKPASFFVPTLMFSINMMEAARRQGVERYLFTSSVGVYEPADVFYEDSVWQTFPSPNDRFAGWAKRMGELQAQAYAIEDKWDKISIVRPANVYGPFDNFNPQNAMVIPSLIRRALSGETPLVVWGDGSAIRDFIFTKDVARGMMMAVEKGIHTPINLGSGQGVSIKDLVETLLQILPSPPKVEWDTSKPTGDAKRLMDTRRAESFGIKPQTSLKDGLRETVDWFLANKDGVDNRYNAFTEKVKKAL